MQDEQYKRMTETKIPRLITTLAVPTVISMLVSALYNTADTYFVSKLGKSASGAVGVVFSLMAVIQAVGFMIGMGSGSIISRFLGAKKEKEANITASSGFFMALLIGMLIFAAGSFFINPLVAVLGSTPTIAPYAVDYARFILPGAPVMAASFVLNNLLRSEGKAKFGMMGIATGGILNIFLDPIFIFIFNLGIKGAASATLLSQMISLGILLSFFIAGKSSLKLHIKYVAKSIGVYADIIKSGLASFARQGLASAASIALNHQAAAYGDAAVSAMTITSKLFMMMFSVGLGFGQGYQPVIGYNYGADKQERVKQAFFFILKTEAVLMTFFGAVFFIFAKQVMGNFINDSEVIEIGITALRCQCAAMPLISVGVVSNMTFQSIGQSAEATLLSSLRQGIYFFPLIFILPHFIGLPGVQITQPAADLLTFVTCVPFLVGFVRETNAKIRQLK